MRADLAKRIYLSCFIYLFVVLRRVQQLGSYCDGSLQVEETSAYCTVNHRASASNYQLSNMKCPAKDSNRRPQRLEARTLTATPLRLPLLFFLLPCMKTFGLHIHSELEFGPKASFKSFFSAAIFICFCNGIAWLICTSYVLIMCQI